MTKIVIVHVTAWPISRVVADQRSADRTLAPTGEARGLTYPD